MLFCFLKTLDVVKRFKLLTNGELFKNIPCQRLPIWGMKKKKGKRKRGLHNVGCSCTQAPWNTALILAHSIYVFLVLSKFHGPFIMPLKQQALSDRQSPVRIRTVPCTLIHTVLLFLFALHMRTSHGFVTYVSFPLCLALKYLFVVYVRTCVCSHSAGGCVLNGV